MKNLRLQDGCHNCKHVFVMMCYDSGPELFCNIDNNRPICGSLAMGEVFPSSDSEEEDSDDDFDKAADEWDKWSAPRRVGHANICTLYVKGSEY